MAKYRKKPVVIDAVQFTGSVQSSAEIVGWAEACGRHIEAALDEDDCTILYIDTLEGRMTANKGDWIIRGIKGEIYPCKDDIFRATYEEVAE